MNNFQHEKRFFEKIYSSALPGWNVELAPWAIGKDAEVSISQFGVHLYLVDTSCDWLAAGSITQESFAQSSEMAKDWIIPPSDLASAAAQALSFVAKDYAAKPLFSTLSPFFAVVAAALRTTEIFRRVGEGNCAGHWFYIGYRQHDGGMLGRPAFLSSPAQPGLMSIEMARDIVASIALRDQTVANACSQLAGAGPLDLHPRYRFR